MTSEALKRRIVSSLRVLESVPQSTHVQAYYTPGSRTKRLIMYVLYLSSAEKNRKMSEFTFLNIPILLWLRYVLKGSDPLFVVMDFGI